MQSPLTLLEVAGIACAAGLASVIGGVVAILRRPTTLLMSLALGFASGLLLATIAFEMLPQARDTAGLPLAAGGFLAGFAGVYAFDLFVHRGKLAGSRAEQRAEVERFYRSRRPRAHDVTVLAGGTSVEEVIEGLSIGAGFAMKPGLGLLLAIAVAIDNFAEGLSIGEIIRRESDGGRVKRRILVWTATIAAALFVSSMAGWLFLREVGEAVIGFLFAIGAGGMFYLTITDLVPESEETQYQQSAAVATAAGFLLMFALATCF